MSPSVEFPELWLIFGAIEKGTCVKTALGKLGIMPRPHDLVLQRPHGLELLPWGLGAGLRGDEREKAFMRLILTMIHLLDYQILLRSPSKGCPLKMDG